MKYKNCFDAVSDAMAISFSEGLRANVEIIALFCTLIDKLSDDSWSDELTVVVNNSESVTVSVKCVSITTSSIEHPLFAIMNLSRSTKITCEANGDLWLHCQLPEEWLGGD